MALESNRRLGAGSGIDAAAEGGVVWRGPLPLGRRRGRIPFALAGVGILLYFGNVALGMGAVKLGWQVMRFNDVGEFLIVLASMIFFVTGLLAVEGQRSDGPQAH